MPKSAQETPKLAQETKKPFLPWKSSYGMFHSLSGRQDHLCFYKKLKKCLSGTPGA
jgi:hypothetical protein